MVCCVLICFCMVCLGNGSYQSYSRSDPGSFRSCSLSVGSFRPGSFGPISGVGRFIPILVGRFGPLHCFTVLIGNKKFSVLPDF